MIVSCFSENAVNVSDASCSRAKGCISPAVTPSDQTAVSSVYRVVLSTTKKEVLVRVWWWRNQTGQGLSIYLGDDEASPSLKLNTNSRMFRKKKGIKQIESDDNSKMELLWDLSAAKYETGPEPVDGFYVMVMVDSEIGLILGDESVVKKMRVNPSMAKVNLISRQEHCSSGNSSIYYATKAQFCETGVGHEIVIRCTSSSSEAGAGAGPVLWVWIDKKTVIRVKRLQWNFRGNQTIFVDGGLLVDLLWDVHDWLFGPGPGYAAVFMFRTRSGLDSRLWLEEKYSVHKDEEPGGTRTILDFSLLVCATKIT